MFAELGAQLAAVDPAGFDRARCEQVLTHLSRLASMVEAARLRVTSQLRRLALETPSLIPEFTIGHTGKLGLKDGMRATERSATVEQVPQFGAALASGDITSAHVDVITRQLHRLAPDQRGALTEQADHLAHVATSSSVKEFEATVQREVRRLVADDGIARLQQQRTATFTRSWTKASSGMVCMYSEFDPESGLRYLNRVEQQLQAMFAESTPDTCPTDPAAKNDHLRALAVLALAGGAPVNTVRPLRAEVSVMVDYRTLREGLHQHSIVDLGADVEVPVETLRRWACSADIIPVVLGGDGVVLDVGRTKRLATADQRRALRAMYPTCAVPGCTVSGRHCEPHHIQYWRNGGATDMGNLVPLCSRHHHAVHEGGWTLRLCAVTRQLTVRLPDGTVQSTGPPSARAG